MNTWHDYLSHKIDVFKEFDTNFNFAKIHLMSHLVEQICRYGVMKQYFAARYEHAHKPNLKDGWNTFNHNLNYLPQLISFQRCIRCFKIRELKLKAITQLRENSDTACNVLPSGAD